MSNMFKTSFRAPAITTTTYTFLPIDQETQKRLEAQERLDNLEIFLEAVQAAIDAHPTKAPSSRQEIEEFLTWQDFNCESGPKPPDFPAKMDKPYTLLTEELARLVAERDKFLSQLPSSVLPLRILPIHLDQETQKRLEAQERQKY